MGIIIYTIEIKSESYGGSGLTRREESPKSIMTTKESATRNKCTQVEIQGSSQSD